MTDDDIEQMVNDVNKFLGKLGYIVARKNLTTLVGTDLQTLSLGPTSSSEREFAVGAAICAAMTDRGKAYVESLKTT